MKNVQESKRKMELNYERAREREREREREIVCVCGVCVCVGGCMRKRKKREIGSMPWKGAHFTK
jgi:hypothetical protein